VPTDTGYDLPPSAVPDMSGRLGDVFAENFKATVTALNLKNLTVTILEANNTINVKYYGATGDGTTDDTTAINAAIAAITSTYATLYFPSGTYVVSSTLTLASSVRVVGDGQASTTVYLKSSSNCDVFHVTASNVSFENLTINGNLAGNTGNLCGIIYTTTLSNLTLKAVTVLNCAATGVQMTSSSNVLVDGCTMKGSGGQQFTYLFSVVVSSNVTLVNSIFNATASTSSVTVFFESVAASGSVSNILIDNCIISFPQSTPAESDGIVLDSTSGDPSISDVIMSNNVIFSPAGARTGGANGIELSGVSGVVISGNTFYNQTTAIGTRTTGNNHTAITGNTIVGGAASADGDFAAIVFTSGIDLSITDNVIYNHMTGISVASVLQSRISNNIIYGAGTESCGGINLTNCTDLLVNDNLIYGGPTTAFYAIVDGGTMVNCAMRNNLCDGMTYSIYLNATHTKCTLSGTSFGTSAAPYYISSYTGLTVSDDYNQTFTYAGTGGMALVASPLTWEPTPFAAADAGISRLGPASLAAGNGTANDTSGNISAKTHTVTASSGAPTSAGTAGTIGQIIAYGGFLYYCSVTGVAGSAMWNKLTMTAV